MTSIVEFNESSLWKCGTSLLSFTSAYMKANRTEHLFSPSCNKSNTLSAALLEQAAVHRQKVLSYVKGRAPELYNIIRDPASAVVFISEAGKRMVSLSFSATLKKIPLE